MPATSARTGTTLQRPEPDRLGADLRSSSATRYLARATIRISACGSTRRWK
jgi:hypothetical protein